MGSDCRGEWSDKLDFIILYYHRTKTERKYWIASRFLCVFIHINFVDLYHDNSHFASNSAPEPSPPRQSMRGVNVPPSMKKSIGCFLWKDIFTENISCCLGNLIRVKK